MSLIAIGNSDDAGLTPVAIALLSDPSPLVRAMAVWALSRLLDAGGFAVLRNTYAPDEGDQDVAAEWSVSSSPAALPSQ